MAAEALAHVALAPLDETLRSHLDAVRAEFYGALLAPLSAPRDPHPTAREVEAQQTLFSQRRPPSVTHTPEG